MRKLPNSLRAWARGVAAVPGLWTRSVTSGPRRRLSCSWDTTSRGSGAQRRLEQNENRPCAFAFSQRRGTPSSKLIASAIDPHRRGSSPLRPRAAGRAPLLSMLDGRPAPARTQEDLVARTLTPSRAPRNRMLPTPHRAAGRSERRDSESGPRRALACVTWRRSRPLLLIAVRRSSRRCVSGVRSPTASSPASNLGSPGAGLGSRRGQRSDLLPMVSQHGGACRWNVGNGAGVELWRTPSCRGADGLHARAAAGLPDPTRATQVAASSGIDDRVLPSTRFQWSNLFASDHPRWSARENGTGPVSRWMDRSPAVPLGRPGFPCINPLLAPPNHRSISQNALFQAMSCPVAAAPVLSAGG